MALSVPLVTGTASARSDQIETIRPANRPLPNTVETGSPFTVFQREGIRLQDGRVGIKAEGRGSGNDVKPSRSGIIVGQRQVTLCGERSR
jgi:hypothetical protein